MNGKYLFSILLILVFAIPFAVPTEGEEVERGFPPQAILIAAYMGNAELVHDILVSGADKNVRDSLGHTALHLAMYHQNNLAVIKLLLDYGFDPNAIATRNGHTPLHTAVTADNETAVRFLLQNGANKNIKCLDGYTPLDMARSGDKQRLASLLFFGR